MQSAKWAPNGIANRQNGWLGAGSMVKPKRHCRALAVAAAGQCLVAAGVPCCGIASHKGRGGRRLGRVDRGPVVPSLPPMAYGGAMG